MGFIVGQLGYVATVGTFVMAYFICLLTILSLSAISTNGRLAAISQHTLYLSVSSLACDPCGCSAIGTRRMRRHSHRSEPSGMTLCQAL